MATPITTAVKLTPEVLRKLEEGAALDCTIGEMALWADISRQTLYNWLEHDPDLKERLDKLREKPMLKARNTIIKNLDTVETAKWYAERKSKKEFAQRSELTGAEGTALQINVVAYNPNANDNPAPRLPATPVSTAVLPSDGQRLQAGDPSVGTSPREGLVVHTLRGEEIV